MAKTLIDLCHLGPLLFGLVLLVGSAVSAPPARPDDMPARVAQPAARGRCNPGTVKIALDVGHYRARPGAISATGVTEFTYNRSLARTVLAGLRRNGFSSAFMIGESGDPLPLERRTQIASQAGADLFISLHHDSVQPRYLSQWSVDGRSQHYSDRFHGYSIFISGKNPHWRESREFATLLGQALLDKGLTPSLHHAEDIPGENRPLIDARIGLYQFDDLVVLKTASSPAILLESGIIVNRAEEQQIRDGDYDTRVAAALLGAITQYCGGDNGRKTALPNQ
jgi:N-acetylmuramoyl-L-alanine amidase